MASIINAAAQRLNADTAGRTHTGGEPNPGQAAAATPAEIYHSAVHTATGALDSLFRQEPVAPGPVSTATEAPAGSAGPHGGRIPSAVSHVLGAIPGAAPGPSVGPSGTAVSTPGIAPGISPAVVRNDVVSAAGTARQSVAHTIATLRRRLGV